LRAGGAWRRIAADRASTGSAARCAPIYLNRPQARERAALAGVAYVGIVELGNEVDVSSRYPGEDISARNGRIDCGVCAAKIFCAITGPVGRSFHFWNLRG